MAQLKVLQLILCAKQLIDQHDLTAHHLNSCAGGSIEAIAEAKAGIMKAKRPVVIAKQPYPEALQVLEQHAKRLDCPVIRPHDLVKLTAKETLHEHGSMFQMVAADPHGVPWLQPTGTASDCICCLLHHVTDISHVVLHMK